MGGLIEEAIWSRFRSIQCGRRSQFLDACIKRAPVLRVLTRLGKSGFELSNLGIDVGCGGWGGLLQPIM